MIFGMTKSGGDLRVNRDKFTIGTYYISYYASQEAKRLADVKTLHALGYDYIATPCASNDTDLFSLLRDLGMGLMIEYNEDPKSGVLSAADAYGIVIGHIPGDDVDLNFANAAAFASTEAEYQALDTNKLTLCSVTNGNTKSSVFAGTSDLMGVQVYPIPAETLEAMEYHYVNARSSCTSANVPLLGHVQTNKFSGQRMPTVGEFLCMAWGAIQFGCDGILMYAAYDCTPNGGNPITITDIFTNDSDMVDLRCAIRNFITDVKRYEYFFLRGTRSNSYNSTSCTTTWTDSTTGQRLRIANNYTAKTVTLTVET